MIEWFLSLSIEIRISIISIISSTVVSIISVSIALISLLKTNKITKEANRPSVVLFLESISVTSSRNKYIVIKNFGNTPAVIDNIICSREIDFCFSLDPFKNLIKSTLAPNQSIVTACELKNVDEVFSFTIYYSNNNRKFSEVCYINPRTTENILSIKDTSSYKNPNEKLLINLTEELIKSKF